MATATRNGESEMTILARILGAEEGRMSDELARYILELDVGERDRERMHDLAVRNPRTMG